MPVDIDAGPDDEDALIAGDALRANARPLEVAEPPPVDGVTVPDRTNTDNATVAQKGEGELVGGVRFRGLVGLIDAAIDPNRPTRVGWRNRE